MHIHIYPSLPTGDLISRIWIALDDMTMDLGPLECPGTDLDDFPRGPWVPMMLAHWGKPAS